MFRTRSFLPTRSRLALAWGLPLLGAAVVLGMWLVLSQMLAAERARLREDGLARAGSLARAYAEYTERKLDQIDQLARFVANNRQRYGSDAGLEALVRSQLALDPGLKALSVVDREGRVVASTLKNLQASMADRDYFRTHVEHDSATLYTGQVLVSRMSGQPMMLMSRRVNAADGSFDGVVSISANPAYFTWFYDKASFGEHGVAELVGLEDGRVRTRRIGDVVTYTGTGPDFALQGVKTQRRGSMRSDGAKLEGRPRYVAYQRLADYPLMVVTALDEAEVFAGFEQRRRRLYRVFGGLTAGFVLAFGGLWLLLRRLRGSQERALRAQADFEAALDASLDAFRILQAVRSRRGDIMDFRYLHCNDLAAQMLGLPKAEVLGRLRSQVMHGVGDRRFYDLCCEVVVSRQSAEVEFLTRRQADQAMRWLHHQVVPVGDGVAVTTRDVTDSRAEAAQLEAGRLALQARERMLNAIADNIPALISRVDQDLRYTYANAGLRRLYGRDDLAGMSMPEVRGPQDYALVAPHFEQALRGEAVTFERTRRYGGTGPARTYQVQLVPDTDAAGRVAGVYTMGFEVTALAEARSRLAEQERRLRGIADNLPVLIGYIDREERFAFANQTYRSWFGRDPAELIGRSLQELLTPQRYAARKVYLDRALSGERVGFEADTHTADAPLDVRRTLHSTYVPNVAADGGVLGVYMLSFDVTELKNTQRRLFAAARTDVLTGLPNRLAFGEILPVALARSVRQRNALSLMFLDIDRFKAINDSLGHAGGDTVLTEFAARLKASVRLTDSVARLAGDEFVVLLESVADRAAAQAVAEKIRDKIAGTPFMAEGVATRVSTSIGIACQAAGAPATSPGDLLARADAALYTAKAMGRDRFEFAP